MRCARAPRCHSGVRRAVPVDKTLPFLSTELLAPPVVRKNAGNRAESPRVSERRIGVSPALIPQPCPLVPPLLMRPTMAPQHRVRSGRMGSMGSAL
jgi:hypothetical protein